ncbi:MAG: hypothetical protein AAGI07_02510 [Bacteroidota bacterium]
MIVNNDETKVIDRLADENTLIREKIADVEILVVGNKLTNWAIAFDITNVADKTFEVLENE